MIKADQLRERIVLLEQEYKDLIELKDIAQLRAVTTRHALVQHDMLSQTMKTFLQEQQIDPDAFFNPGFI